MSTSTVEDKVKDLLGRNVVSARPRGLADPILEAAALFETVALTLLLNPKCAVYLALMARNGLLAQVAEEIAIIDNMLVIIGDILNKKYPIKGRDVLERIKNSLLQMENMAKISSDSALFKRFSEGVDDFIKNHLGKNVKKYGAKALTRSASEAKKDLQLEYTILKDAHKDLTDRLYALVVSVTNFELTPISAGIGVSAATRVRGDVDSMIELLSGSEDDAIAGAQQMALSLLTSRAALRTIGTLPKIDTAVVDADNPVGYTLKAVSRSTVFPLANPAQLIISGSVNGEAVPVVDLRPFVAGGDILTVSAQTRRVVSVSKEYITLDSAVSVLTPTSFTVTSGIVDTWGTVQKAVQSFLTDQWSDSGYNKDTSKLDSLFLALKGEASPGNVNSATTELNKIRALLVTLQGVLSVFTPNGTTPVEKRVTDKLLNSLEERKLDRSVDFMLRGKIVEALGLDLDTGSYAGNVMRKMSTFVKKYGKYPDAAKDEGFDPRSSSDRVGGG